jgi:FkbH-like protein
MDACDFLFPKTLRATPSNIKRILVIGSCLSEAYIERAAASIGEDVEVDYILFNNISDLPTFPPAPINSYDFQYIQMPLRTVVTDKIIDFQYFSSNHGNLEMIENAFNSCKLILDASLEFNRKFGLLAFVSNFFVPQNYVTNSLDRIGTEFDFSALVRRLNEYISKIISKLQNVYIADIESIGQAMGKQSFLDDSTAFYSHMAYWQPSIRDLDVLPLYNAPARIEPLPRLEDIYGGGGGEQMFRAVWHQMEHLFRIVRQIDMVKLVIFDLDDTMWRGQIAEHYTDAGSWPVFHGWPLGTLEAVQHLRARGIMVGICSKNEVSLVRARWDRAIYNSWVTLDDFLFQEINWNPKAENIDRIIRSASLTPKSVVFVDDNPVEREAVREALPGIRVIGANPYVTKRILLWSSETQVATITSESANREAMMRRQQDREAERRSLSRDEFLLGLKCEVRITEFASDSSEFFSRCLELLNKTNQFNTTGKRHTPSDLRQFFESRGSIFAFHVQDKFTSYGLVGVIMYQCGQFTQIAMSCRVLGLEIETSVLNTIVAHKRKIAYVAEFSARVEETESNMVCRDVFARCGFVNGEGDAGEYRLAPDCVGGVASHLNITLRDETAVIATAEAL